MITLSPRLKAAADMAANAKRIIDVGCDHGYLSAYMLSEDVGRTSYACDINRGPLDNAHKTAVQYGLTDRIELRLCDGLSGFTGEECDTVFICGMGGELIADILGRAPWTADGKHTLILQPMTKSEKLREFLYENGYSIQQERGVYDDKRLYCVMRATGPKGDCGENSDFMFSESFKEDKLFGDYIKMLHGRYTAVLNTKKSAGKDISDETRLIKILEDTHAY